MSTTPVGFMKQLGESLMRLEKPLALDTASFSSPW